MNGKYKVIDLFSGCGGSALGFKQAGYDIRVALDKDKTACESFKKNFKNCTVINGDIVKISGQELLRAGNIKKKNEIVLIACPPCQGFSNARRVSQRLNDPRNKLILELIRIIDEIRPRAFVFENVPGLTKGEGKKLLDEVLGKLNEYGYKITYQVINTADYGVPQQRKRVVIIGVKGSKVPNFPSPTHSNHLKGDTVLPPWKSVRDAISDLPVIKAGETYGKDPLHHSATLAEINLKRMAITPHDGGDRMSWPDELVLECHKKNGGHKDVYGRMKWDQPSPTMTGGCAMISKGRFGHPEQDRAISLREAARLQTFTDDFVFVGNFGEIAKQIGNAVPPLLGKITAKAVLKEIKR